MFKHIALLNWHSSVTEEQILGFEAALAELPRLIPLIRSYAFHRDAKVYQGNADFVVTAEFANFDDFKAYVVHPDHVAISEGIGQSMISDYAAVQYAD